MPSSVSRQNEPNHRLWLACSAGGFGTVVFFFRAAILDSLETMAVWTTDGNIHSSCRNPHALQAKAMIGYPIRQDGAILPARYHLQCPAVKISRKPNNKSFIDQAFSVKMAGYWCHSFFASLWTSPPSTLSLVFDILHLISTKHKWNNRFIKNAPKI